MTMTLDARARKVTQAQLYINGEWVAPKTGQSFPAVDPNTGATIAGIPRGTAADVGRAVAAAKAAAIGWQFTDAIARAALLRQLGALVTEHADELARLEALDSGHYLSKARDLMGAIPLWLDYFAGLADKVGGRTIEVPGNKLSFTPARAARRHRPHHPVELPAADPGPLVRVGAGDGQHLRGQAGPPA